MPSDPFSTLIGDRRGWPGTEERDLPPGWWRWPPPHHQRLSEWLGRAIATGHPVLRTVSDGRITGAYVYEAGPRAAYSDVQWRVTQLERNALTAEAQKDIGQRSAFFEVTRAGAEFSDLVRPGPLN